MKFSLKSLGPGLLFAGAAIGVSHLVQSTRAGADFGLGLIWALLLVNLFKYPFFQFGPRYASATGESLLDGYKKLGKGVLVAYYIITFATMFTIQTAVTIVTTIKIIKYYSLTTMPPEKGAYEQIAATTQIGGKSITLNPLGTTTTAAEHNSSYRSNETQCMNKSVNTTCTTTS